MMPFNPKDWTAVLPASIIALAFLVFIGVWAANQLGIVKKNGTGSVPGHRTFADDPDRYWDRMRQVVTEPLAKVLDKQTDMFQSLLTEIARIDERAKLRDKG